jgi:hypothetical protein
MEADFTSVRTTRQGEVCFNIGQKGYLKRKGITHRAGATTIPGGLLRRPLYLLARFPVHEIAPKDKEFAADLNDRNAIFLNDSAEMAKGEPRHASRGWNVHECFGSLGGSRRF